jgi:hypothetical protein
MSALDYFFINHTRKEFCCFDNNESIIQSIELAIYKNIGWEMTDDIRVESQLASDTDVLDYLSCENYKNTDLDGPTESEGDSREEEGESMDDEMGG